MGANELEGGKMLTQDLKIVPFGRDVWHCDSATSGRTYRITLERGQYHCNCPARVECKHIKQLKELNKMQTDLKTAELLKTKGFRRSILEILTDFQHPIPDRFIKTKTLKGNKIRYVPWHCYIRLLEYYAPGFDWEVRTHVAGDRTVVEGRLTIRAMEGDFTREATGTEDNEVDSYGDPSSNAEAMALRRCCAKFGLGLHLWEKP
jgi:hypothetical protein